MRCRENKENILSELEKQARAIFSELLKQAQGPHTGSFAGDCEAWPECGVTSVEQFVEFTVPILAAFATQVREKTVAECAEIGHSRGQSERYKRLIEGIENTAITYYGPHECDLCGKKSIVRGSAKDGFGDLCFEYPLGIVYPNHNWTLHTCVGIRHDKKESTDGRSWVDGKG